MESFLFELPPIEPYDESEQPSGWWQGGRRPFNPWRECDDPNFGSVVDRLLDELAGAIGTGKVKKKRREYEIAIKRIILDLYIAHKQNPAMTVHYGRARADYERGSTYFVAGVKYGKMVEVTEFLEESGYIENSVAWRQNPSNKRKFRSVMRAEPALIALIEYGLSQGPKLRVRRPEIVLKDRDKEIVRNLHESPKVTKWRDNVRAINRMIAKSEITLDIPEAEKPAYIASQGHLPDFTAISLYRVFNGAFNMGGRFYGPWWQMVPKNFRKRIKIDGGATTEYDFSGLHGNLLYAELGRTPPAGYLYELDREPEDLKQTIKDAFMCLLNAKSKRAAIYATINIEEEGKPKRAYGDVKRIIDKLINKHQDLRDFFYSGRGLEIQFKDSQLCEMILLKLMAKGIVALPIHDSFLCAVSHEGELRQAMDDSAVKLLGTTLPYKKEF